MADETKPEEETATMRERRTKKDAGIKADLFTMVKDLIKLADNMSPQGRQDIEPELDLMLSIGRSLSELKELEKKVEDLEAIIGEMKSEAESANDVQTEQRSRIEELELFQEKEGAQMEQAPGSLLTIHLPIHSPKVSALFMRDALSCRIKLYPEPKIIVKG